MHGGLIATIADEAMVWAATWAIRRFCYCGELTVRYRKPARPRTTLRFEAKVESARSRLITTSFRCFDEAGDELSSGNGKYVPISADDNARVLESFVIENDSREAAEVLAVTLSLFSPYTAEEMWERLGHAAPVALAGWPSADPALLVQESVTCVVQVAGKVRDRLEVAPDIADHELERLALASEKIRAALGDRGIRKVVVRAPKIVNIVPA